MTHSTKIDSTKKNMERRKKFPILFINIIVSAIFSISVLYFFVIHYSYSMNPNLSVFGLYTLFFGIINAIGILIFPDFFDSSVVMVLLGIIIIVIVNWYG